MKDQETKSYLENETKSEEHVIQVLTFSLGNDTYGIEVECVTEVDSYDKVFTIPRAPEYIRGVMNLRGEIVPVIDLCSLFLGCHFKCTKFTSIIILSMSDGEETVKTGVVIDAVKEVKNFSESSIETAPGFGLKINHEFVKGIAKTGGEFIILLNIASIWNILVSPHVKSGKKFLPFTGENGVGA